MKKSTSLALSVFALILCVSCNGGSEDDTPSNEQGVIKTVQNIEPMDGNKLAEILPRSLPGAGSTSPTSGKVSNDGRVMTTVTAEYRFHLGGYAIISITDYTDLEEFKVPLRALHNSPSIDGKDVIAIEREEGIGMRSWDAEERSGRLRFLAYDRFGLTIEITNMPEELAKPPEAVLTMIDLRALAKR